MTSTAHCEPDRRITERLSNSVKELRRTTFIRLPLRRLLGMMGAAPSYRHPDVLADMLRAVEKAAARSSRDSLQLITPDL